MTMILKAMAGLLTYPQENLISALPEIGLLIGSEPRLPEVHKAALLGLANDLTDDDLLSSQEHYVDVFDRGRATSLHLFEHVHGESRDRGMAMIDLGNVYEKAGLSLRGNELPDYLPAVLEYLSTRSQDEVHEMLGDCAHILRKVGEALRDRGSHYSVVFAALLALVDEPGLAPAKRRGQFAEEKSVDEEWAEEPVQFGPAAKPACGRAQAQSSVIRFVNNRPH
jgi:nitrate reductase delta subunit